MTERSRRASQPQREGIRLERADRAALAEYLGTLRDAGPALDEHLLAAFERLTPHQLDVLVAAMTAAGPSVRPVDRTEARHSTSSGASAPEARRRKRGLSGTAQLVLAAAAACLVCAGGVLAAGLAFGGPAEAGPASGTLSTSVTELGGLDDDGF